MGYYRGDYYRGDPFLGALAGLVAKPLTKLAGKAVSWVGKQALGSPKAAAATVGTALAAAPILRMAAPAPVSSPPPINFGPIGVNPMAALPGGQPLFTYGTRKRRRMNVLNPRALKRALRRAEGFEKIAQRTVNALHRGPKKFKSTKRRG
jgi:hypothetical protein